ncbi:PREDICTED: uncharacterized protein LOC106114561 [Papilio xuthus]|uniref:Uncharacterized protein LOC106114561 n=1 Tax=Papilio xuthus TaxID=66420 RepID=A0AAJ7E5B7_PAPXU|nr:PREDICTED: uncharacterized protein LOC106114561 [Papilio xuthus]
MTWCSPDGKTFNQIDHVLVDSRHYSNLLDVRTHRGANIDSDHFLVVAKIRARISNLKYKKHQKENKYNIQLLKNDNVRTHYQSEIENLLAATDQNESEDPEHQWRKLQNIIHVAAQNRLGYTGSAKRNEWFDEECKAVTDRKNEAYLNMRSFYTRNKHKKYVESRREEKRVHRKKKRAFITSETEDMVRDYLRNDVRKFYQRINKGRREFRPKTSACRDLNGEILSEQKKVLQRWAQHFGQLLGNNVREAPYEQIAVNIPETNILTPTLAEVSIGLKGLKNNKAPGIDNIPGELIKYGGPSTLHALHSLVAQIWNTEKLPSEWNVGTICPLHKKGDVLDCKNYRGISLLCTGYKVLAKVLFNKLAPYVEAKIGEYQCGFRPNRSTIDQIFSLRQILEKTLEYNVDTYHLFVDFKAAYDNVDRAFLYEAMREINIPEKLIRLTKMTLQNTKCKVKVESDYSEPFYTFNGLRQGDALSCLLFNVVLEKCIRDSKIVTSGTIFYKSVQLLGYADDIDIIARSGPEMESAYLALEEASNGAGLTVNAEKTTYMHASRSTPDINEKVVTIGEHNFAVVDSFVYLGSMVTRENEISVEIRRRIMAELNVAGHIKLNRLRWAGHVERMDEARVPKNVMASNPEGRRSRGRPKLRWIDGVNKDAKKVGIANWKSVARDRPRWKKLLDQAKAHKGL